MGSVPGAHGFQPFGAFQPAASACVAHAGIGFSTEFAAARAMRSAFVAWLFEYQVHSPAGLEIVRMHRRGVLDRLHGRNRLGVIEHIRPEHESELLLVSKEPTDLELSATF